MVNYGNATGGQILDLAMRVKDTVHQKFGVELEPEVQVI
jgi:UDP-N-acetylmuramate dehydrogenase